jgi:transposase
MPKRIDVKELQGINFKAIAKQAKSPRLRIRLLGLMHLQEGHSLSAVAKMFNVRWKTAKNWLRKFLTSGVDGLCDKPRSGRKPHLQVDDVIPFKKAIEKLQSKRQGGRVIGKDIQKLLREQFSAEYDLDSIYRLLERVGMVWITARSIHPKADKKAQETFKKTLPKK